MKLWKFLPMLVLLLLTACHSSKSAMEGTSTPDKSQSEEVYMKKVVSNAQRSNNVTAKVNVALSAFGKDLSVDGRLRMRRNEVIQLSLNLLGFEVGRMEFTPQYVLLLDRVNKQYVKANYTEVGFLQQAQLDFYALQSLFWNELFIPGQHDVREGLSRFEYAETGNYALLSLKDTPKLVYTFQTQMEQAIINHVTVKAKSSTGEGKLEWNYDNFTQLDKRYFPSLMSCKISGLDREVNLTLSLSRLNNNDNWTATTNISSRYKERSVEDTLRLLMTM